MKTVILNGSPRKNGDTSILLEKIIPKINGEVKIINTFFENIMPCIDCRKCHNSNECALSKNKNDNMSKFYNDLLTADNLIIASPLHYSMLTGNLLNFVSRFQYFFVSKHIRKDVNFSIKKKNGFLILLGGGTTKDFYPVEKVSNLIFRQLNSSINDIFKYIQTDEFPLKDFEKFENEKKILFENELNKFIDKINFNY